MKCFYCGKEATGICSYCGKAICSDCGNFSEKTICKNSQYCNERKTFEDTIYKFHYDTLKKDALNNAIIFFVFSITIFLVALVTFTEYRLFGIVLGIVAIFLFIIGLNFIKNNYK